MHSSYYQLNPDERRQTGNIFIKRMSKFLQVEEIIPKTTYIIPSIAISKRFQRTKVFLKKICKISELIENCNINHDFCVLYVIEICWSVFEKTYLFSWLTQKIDLIFDVLEGSAAIMQNEVRDLISILDVTSGVNLL